MYKFLSTLIYFVTNIILRKVKVLGKDNVPKNEAFIVTCNHRSMVEIIILAMALYPREIHYMAKQELFKGKVLDRFFKSCNAFPVNRDNPGPSTLKIPVKLIKENKIVGIFPSGRRVDNAPMKKGAATIAVMSKSKIIPAAYIGPTRFRDVIFKKEQCYIKFGSPIDSQVFVEQYKKSEAIDQITSTLEIKTKALIQSLKNEA
ncbi:lysophospholipid acyltransferase family protein [Macrococcoides caseolyticum]|uniref:lysophospholipid acyltransferase family protein n=1 Tax=Macrococcoides caseolyticum TaxID=69966 RepID=UPI001F1C159C|nr:lysophospholipid acyltransferase family protein [Macrococcus caseolyticus]MCE4956355.1 1-acyl-sn-glycerol-3-phosphate acyltransferase [Macrococcus caseolyticus]